MSDDVTDTDDDTTDGVEGGNAAKVLRKQNKDLATKLAEAQKQLDELAGKARRSDLAALFEGANASPKLVKYFPSDAEPTADAVKAWLREEGELFGWDDPDAQGDSGVAEQAAKISRAATDAPAAAIGSPEELLALLKSGDYAALKAQGLVL